MPNCDWGRPCTCSDCREIRKTHVCPSCNFNNKVIIDGIPEYHTDKKGIGGYIFNEPDLPSKDLSCYNCGHVMTNVGYYTSINAEVTEWSKLREDKIQKGDACGICSKVEDMDYTPLFGKVTLKEYNGRRMCQSCIVEEVKRETPDPSDKDNKYVFDVNRLTWVLKRVRNFCKSCNKGYLVDLQEASWRNLCKECYKRRKA